MKGRGREGRRELESEQGKYVRKEGNAEIQIAFTLYTIEPLQTEWSRVKERKTSGEGNQNTIFIVQNS